MRNPTASAPSGAPRSGGCTAASNPSASGCASEARPACCGAEPAASVVAEVAREASAGAVFWNRRYGGAEREVDAALKTALRDDGLTVASFAASLLFEPWTVQTGAGTPYSVFTPFWRACQSMPTPRAPLPEPREIPGPRSAPASDDLDDWELLPTAPGLGRWPSRDVGAGRAGSPRSAARVPAPTTSPTTTARGTNRRRGATSRLSPRLRWGELSPYTVWHETV